MHLCDLYVAYECTIMHHDVYVGLWPIIVIYCRLWTITISIYVG